VSDLASLEEGIRYALSQVGKSVTPPQGSSNERPQCLGEVFLEECRSYRPKMVPFSRRWWALFALWSGSENPCELCGKPVPKVVGWHPEHKRTHGNRRYCSNACRQRAYRKRNGP